MEKMTRRTMLGTLAAVPLAVAAGAEGVERMSAAERKLAGETLLAYFAKIGPMLFRQPGGFLKHPTLSPTQPGKTYSAELWDWDTYWTARGLFRLAKLTGDAELHKQTCEHAQGSLLSFFEAQAEDGRIPIMISVGNKDFFGSTKPGRLKSTNQAKPVMGQLALLLADELGEVEWFRADFEKLLRFYASWGVDNLSGVGLYVWGNDVAVGDDNDPTVFGRPEFSSANLLLNCLFYEDLRAAAEVARRLKRADDAARLGKQADALGDCIQKNCWDARDRFYYTVDVQCRDRRTELLPGLPQGMAMSWHCLPLKVQMFTGFLPMWCGLASSQQAEAMVQANYLADDRLRARGGVRSLSSLETMYSLEAMSGNPSNWLGPVWIIANYFVWKGLLAYGYKDAAAELADKTMRLLADDLAKTGTLNEYYHPDTGAALSHQGFLDWNLLVLEMM